MTKRLTALVTAWLLSLPLSMTPAAAQTGSEGDPRGDAKYGPGTDLRHATVKYGREQTSITVRFGDITRRSGVEVVVDPGKRYGRGFSVGFRTTRDNESRRESRRTTRWSMSTATTSP